MTTAVPMIQPATLSRRLLPGRVVERGDVRDGLAHRRTPGVEIEAGMSVVALIASVS